MKKISVAKLLRNIQNAWSSFRYWNEPEEVRQDMTADWHSMLVAYDDDLVFRALNDFIADESQKFAPSAVDFVRRLKGARRSQDMCFKAGPEFRAQVKKDLKKGGNVFCDFHQRGDQGPTKIWNKREDSIWHGTRWWPKMEFAMYWLGGDFVSTEIRKKFGNLQTGELWGCFSDPHKREQLAHLKDLLVDVARDRAQNSKSKFIEGAPL